MQNDKIRDFFGCNKQIPIKGMWLCLFLQPIAGSSNGDNFPLPCLSSLILNHPEVNKTPIRSRQFHQCRGNGGNNQSLGYFSSLNGLVVFVSSSKNFAVLCFSWLCAGQTAAALFPKCKISAQFKELAEIKQIRIKRSRLSPASFGSRHPCRI